MQETLLPLHLLTLGYTAWMIFHADILGFDWVSGREAVLSEEEIRKSHKGVWIGLSVMITTGLLMFWPMRDYLLHRPQFYAKMAFVLALVVNGFIIGHLQKVATHKSYAMLSQKEKLPLLMSGAVSTVSWVGAAIMGFLLVPGLGI
jgi:hypothetical protein